MQTSLRNVALVAHVDHGKTTLIDAMLRSTGVFAAHEQLVDRVMDNVDQERERGITILAKAASIQWGDTRINLVDTPGHADFGGEVERALSMVDGIVLLVDAAEGPLPQTRYVLSKALEPELPPSSCLNKVDRDDARAEGGARRGRTALPRSRADSGPLDFPVVSAIAREGRSDRRGRHARDRRRSRALLDTIAGPHPCARRRLRCPLQALVTNLDARTTSVGSPWVGSCAARCAAATTSRSSTRRPPRAKRRCAADWPTFSASGASGAVEVDERGAGDLFVSAGFPEVEIGDTFASRRRRPSRCPASPSTSRCCV